MGITVGIDLGTTFSAVAWINPKTHRPEIIENSDDERITPSVIRFFEDGHYICGAEAKDAYEEGKDGCTNAFKRYMGKDDVCCIAYGKEYKARELSAILLTHLKREAEERLGEKITEAVITVPAYFYNEEREDTLYAAEKAGLKVRQLINEPTAAAMNYGLKQWRENAIIMVYDLGGGTFDVTLVGMGKNFQLESLVTKGDSVLGGKDWDKELAKLVTDKLYDEQGIDVGGNRAVMNELGTRAENWKKTLSRFTSVECAINIPGVGTAKTAITRAEFEEATIHLLGKTIVLCEDVLRGKGLAWRDVTDVLLVGGSTRMPQVSEALAKLTGKKPLAHVNPDEAVVLGAAMETVLREEEYVVYVPKAEKPAAGEGKKGLLAAFRRESEPEKQAAVLSKYSGQVQQAKAPDDIALIGKRDVQAHGMGIISVNEQGTAYINENIIPPNMQIPVKSARAFKFHTTARGDNELEIFVLEGEGKPLECQINAKYLASGFRHVQGGETTVRVQYSFDKNSIIHVQVRQENDSNDLPMKKVQIQPDELVKFGREIDPNEFKTAVELNIVMALDVSGSMYGTPMEEAKNAMISFVRQYQNSGAKIGVVIVSDSTEWVQHLTDDHAKCISAIRSIACDGRTGYGNSAHPFNEILSELDSADGTRCAIVLADGVWSYKDAAQAGAKACNDAGILTAAIGFGQADQRFLDLLSSSKDLSILTKQSELTRSFGKIAQSIGSGGGVKKGRDGANNMTETWDTND